MRLVLRNEAVERQSTTPSHLLPGERTSLPKLSSVSPASPRLVLRRIPLFGREAILMPHMSAALASAVCPSITGGGARDRTTPAGGARNVDGPDRCIQSPRCTQVPLVV